MKVESIEHATILSPVSHQHIWNILLIGIASVVSKQHLLCCPILGQPFQCKSKLFCKPTCVYEVKRATGGTTLEREPCVFLSSVVFIISSPVLHLITSAIWHAPQIAQPMNNIRSSHLTRWKCMQCTVGRLQWAEVQLVRRRRRMRRRKRVYRYHAKACDF